MGINEALCGQAWSNQIPLKIQLATDNITSPARPHPLYILVPRQSFLCSVANQAWPYFQHVLPHLPGHQGLRPWFDHKQLPLRGHLPVGVLFDFLSTVSQDTSSLPWELTIHYTGLPDVLSGWQNGLNMHTLFFHALKEACFICRGPDGAASVMKMNGVAQDLLWASVERAEWAKYRAAMSALHMVPCERHDTRPAVPVRLLVRASTGSLLATWDDSFMTSRPVPAVNADGSASTLEQLLTTLLPHLRFKTAASVPPEPLQTAALEPARTTDGKAVQSDLGPSMLEDADALSDAAEVSCLPKAEATEQRQQPEGPGERDGAQDMLQTALAGAGMKASVSRETSAICQALVSGMAPPLETPVAWLHAHLHAPDYFLYVVVAVQCGA